MILTPVSNTGNLRDDCYVGDTAPDGGGPCAAALRASVEKETVVSRECNSIVAILSCLWREAAILWILCARAGMRAKVELFCRRRAYDTVEYTECTLATLGAPGTYGCPLQGGE